MLNIIIAGRSLKTWYDENKATINETNKQRYGTDNTRKEQIKTRVNQWKRDNREYAKEQAKQRKNTNNEKQT